MLLLTFIYALMAGLTYSAVVPIPGPTDVNSTATVINYCDNTTVTLNFTGGVSHVKLSRDISNKLNMPSCKPMELFSRDKEKWCLRNRQLDVVWTHNIFLSTVHLLKDWRCKSVSFVTDGTTGLTPLTIIKMAIKIGVLDVQVIVVDPNPQSLNNVPRTVTKNLRNVVVLCGDRVTDMIIQWALKTGLLVRPIFWILVAAKVPDSLWQLGPELATQVVILNPYLVEHGTNVTSVQSRNLYDFLRICSNGNLEEGHDLDLVEIYVFMHEIYYSELTNHTEEIYFAKWDATEGLQYREMINENATSGRMKGYRMLTISYIDPPHLYFIRHNTTMVGYQLEMAQAASEYMNFLLHVPLTTDKRTGVQIGKGNWIGLVGNVYRREIDFGTGIVGRTQTRADVVLYSYYTGEGSMMLLLKRPIEEDMKFGVYLQPFTYHVWLAVIGIETLLYLCYLMARFFCNVYLPDQESAKDDPLQKENKFWALASGSVLIQDVTSNIFPSASAKVLFGMFILILEVCLDYYTSIFTSFLAIYTIRMPFETLEELMASDYAVGVVNGTSHHDILKSSDHGLYATVWNRINSFGDRDVPTDKTDALRQVLRRKLAVLVEGFTMMGLIQDNCTYAFSRKRYVIQAYSMPVRKDLPMQKAFSMSFLKMNEHGIKKKLMKQYTPKDLKICEQNNGFVQMGFPHVISLFILLVFGIAVSFLALLIEVAIYRGLLSKPEAHSKKAKLKIGGKWVS